MPNKENRAETKVESKKAGLEKNKMKGKETVNKLPVTKLPVTIEKVKGLRGILYRKLKDLGAKVGEKAAEEKGSGKGSESSLPGFKMKKIKRIAEFPEVDDISKVDITYPLIEPFVYANIKWDNESKELVYNVIEPELTEKEKKTMKKISDALIELVEVELTAVTDEGKAMEYLEKQINKIFKEFGIKLSQDQYVKFMYYVYRNFIGFNEIEPFLQDPNIEDISCDGIGIPVYVIHRKFGSLKTNVIFDDLEYLREFIIKLAERCGRYVSYAEPILAGTLPDGSRVSATLAGDVATHGPVFTIRKFSERPFSPVDQIKLNTASSDVLAYFWYIVEHGASILIVGGVSTGKTSFLNSLCMFIPPEAKIVSIEDTRELRIPNEHWIPSLARTGFGIPMPTGEKYGGVSLFDLLKESFRQNPDYVIVGETRGKEAYVMFQGMSSGHPSMSTFHAGSVDTVIKRLTTPPIELSPTLIESLNVITVMVHARTKGKSARRVREVVEINSVDPNTGKVDTTVVFKWDPAHDVYEKVNESNLVKKLTESRGGTLEEANAEIQRRKEILEWMLKNDITDFEEVTQIINQYYKEPAALIEGIKSGKFVVEKKEKLEEKKALKPSPEIKALEPETAPKARVPKTIIPKTAPTAPSATQEIIGTTSTAETKAEEAKKRAALQEEKASILSLFGFKVVKEVGS